MNPVELPVLTTLAAVEAELKAPVPVLLLVWHDRPPRRDTEIALKEAADKYGQRMRAYIVDARHDPALVERFGLGQHPILVGWYGGEEHIRRNRPWNTDVIGIVEQMLALVPVPAGAEQPPAPPAGNDKPIHVTAETFVEKVLKSPIPVIVDFWADWCQPCKMVAPILDKLAKEYAGKVRIAKVDVDANPELAGQFNIRSIPTLMFVKNGKILGQSAGAAPEAALRDVIQQLIALQV